MRAIVVSSSVAVGIAMLAGALVATEHPARACGGCFHVPTPMETTVVTDHRMAFSVSTQQTVLWDQIKYTGSPSDFAWVLPVKQGAVVELSHDEWFAALDAVTQPVITGPTPNCGGNGGGGLGCGSSAGNAASGFNGATGDDSVGGGGQPPVQVVNQSTIGPFDTVTLRSTDPNALVNWLDSHGYAIPDPIRPTIDAYVAGGFDFIALRLKPGAGVQAMQPVRVVTQGADPTLPLRMVAAGVGAKVGITLYVIGEGRYEAQNFPNAVFDDSKLLWDPQASASNYQPLSEQLMQQQNGRTWLTEYAQPTTIDPTDPSPVCRSYAGGGGTGSYNVNGSNLGDVYLAQCACMQSSTGQALDASFDVNTEGGDDGSADGASGEASASDGATADASPTPDASGDAATGDGASGDGATGDDGGFGNPDASTGGACVAFDDYKVALVGMHPADTWVTRMRAILPVDALHDGDLILQAEATQRAVSNQHTTESYTDPNYSPCPTTGGCSTSDGDTDTYSRWVVLGALGFIAVSLVRRRRRA
jgi:hypothetical protein